MEPGRAVTLQDIADRLGVSRSTASFAITGRGRVSDDTRRRVLELAAELGYRPNTVARNLKGARTGMIALRLPLDSTAMSYYMEATFGIAEEADKAGMVVFVLPSAPEIGGLHSLPADAVIALDPDLNDPAMPAILAGRIPVITGEPVPPGMEPGRGEVTSDHATAVREVLNHLRDRGAEHPVALMSDLRSHWPLTVRATYEAWCVEHGIEPQVSLLPHPTAPETIHSAVSDLLTDHDHPVDAILAITDGTALSVITSAQLLGRTVGDDLLVATMVDSQVLALAQPSVTAVDLHPRELGRVCVRAAIAALDADAVGDHTPIREIVPITVNLRASTTGTTSAAHEGII